MDESAIDKHTLIKSRGAVSNADVYGMAKDFAADFMLENYRPWILYVFEVLLFGRQGL